MTIDEALSIISNLLGPDVGKNFKRGLPNGSESSWKYDERLCIEVAESCLSWKDRLCPIEDPWKVSFYNGNDWSDYTNKPMYHQDAYRVWYKVTEGGSVKNKSSCGEYYRLVKFWHKFELDEPEDEEEDSFSIRYLLDKSFGG